MSTPRSATRARRAPALPDVGPGCTGCGRCVAACPPAVLSLHADGWRKIAQLHDTPGCTGCGRCVPACPFDAIRMVRTAR